MRPPHGTSNKEAGQSPTKLAVTTSEFVHITVMRSPPNPLQPASLHSRSRHMSKLIHTRDLLLPNEWDGPVELVRVDRTARAVSVSLPKVF
jgi:hypothetical protein